VIKAELYLQSGRPVVVIERGPACNAGAWARLLEALSRGVVDGSPTRADVRADVFMAEVEVLREVRTLFAERVELGHTLAAQIRKLAADRRAREAGATVQELLDPARLEAELEAAGFVRKLKPFQLQNLSSMLRLPHGADFSVPGAGKTTVALASFAINRHRSQIDRMLVIGPIAAFEAWKLDSRDCFAVMPRIAIHQGPDALVPDNAEILLTNYNRVANDYDRIRSFVAGGQTMVVLDEAHRVKRGADGVHGRAVLDLAYAAHRRDVLTGTPAPQGAHDLVALMRFLYPGQDAQILPPSAYREKDGRDVNVVAETREAISRYFVRTTKSKLGLPPTTFDVVRQPMGSIQHAVYAALLGRYRGNFVLDPNSRRELDRIGRIVMYLLEAATNPMLLMAGSDLADDPEFTHPPLEVRGDEPLMDLLRSYPQHETPWKYRKIAEIVADASARGEKVLIWSSFVRNLKALRHYLATYKPAVIHGGVPSEDAKGSGAVTREDELRKFQKDPQCSVLLANPAACGEGVSLHHECHHAVYLDRTFNAGQFLQSQDRIHRLGLADHIVTRFTLLLSEGSIDESVSERLRDKVRMLSMLMDDPGLVLLSLPEPDEGHAGPPAFADDLQAVIAHIEGPASGAA
jgi:SNF2 family DNA or RNA helicase